MGCGTVRLASPVLGGRGRAGGRRVRSRPDARAAWTEVQKKSKSCSILTDEKRISRLRHQEVASDREMMPGCGACVMR